MTVHTFFTSAAGGDHDREMVLQFHTDLENAVKRTLGRDASGKLGLLIDPGRPWEQQLLGVCRTARVLVALISPDYPKQPWCQREWEIFWDRVRRATAPGEEAPGCILNIRWSRGLRDDLPAPFRDLQWPQWTLTDDYGVAAKYRAKGLAFLMRNDRAAYRLLCDELGFVVAEASRLELPPLVPGEQTGSPEGASLPRQSAPTTAPTDESTSVATTRDVGPEPALVVVSSDLDSRIDPVAQLLAQVASLGGRDVWQAFVQRIGDLKGRYVVWINPKTPLPERCQKLVDHLRQDHGEQGAYILVLAGVESVGGGGEIADAIKRIIGGESTPQS